MLKKLSVTLTRNAEQALEFLSEHHAANHSVVTETALMHFAALNPQERDHLIRSMQASKKAYTRGRWRAAFWDAIFDKFWFPARLRGGRRSDFTPLTFAGYQVWFLGNSLANFDPEDGDFFVQTMANPNETRIPPADAQRSNTFQRNQSPYEAAREVADFIFETSSALGLLDVIQIPGGGRAQLDHAGNHWMAENEDDQTRQDLPIKVSSKGQAYTLERDYILKRAN
jgi:hypothetical protein